MRDRARILITGAGGPAAIGVMRALDGMGFEIHAADIDPYAQGLYAVPVDQRLLVPRGDHPEFAGRVQAECIARKIDVLVPTVEAEMLPLVGVRSALSRDGIHLLAPSRDALEICLDKWLLINALAPSPHVPPTELLDSRIDFGGWEFPVFVKPRRGSGSVGARVVSDQATLRTLPRDGTLIVQELLSGEEFSVDALMLGATGEQPDVHVVVRERLKVDSGIAVTARVIRDETMEDAARSLVRELGVAPISNVQFRQDRHGVPRLLEINPRVPGTMALTVAAGINMPALAINAALGVASPPVPEVTPVAMVRALEDRVVPLHELDAMILMSGAKGAHVDEYRLAV